MDMETPEGIVCGDLGDKTSYNEKLLWCSLLQNNS